MKKLYLSKTHSDILIAFQEGTLDQLPYPQKLIDSTLDKLTNMGVIGNNRNMGGVTDSWEVVKHGK